MIIQLRSQYSYNTMIAVGALGIVAIAGVALGIIGLSASRNGIFKPIVELGAKKIRLFWPLGVLA